MKAALNAVARAGFYLVMVIAMLLIVSAYCRMTPSIDCGSTQHAPQSVGICRTLERAQAQHTP